MTIEEAKNDPKMQAYLEGALKAVNSNAEVCPSSASKIQKFQILPQDLSLNGNELTATLKVKRSVVVEKYHSYIDAMY